MLAGDWVSFDFSYSLDFQRLIPHILAIEEYQAAVLSPVLPPHWLEAPDGLEDTTTSGAEAAPSVESPAGERPPIRDTGAAQAWIRQRFVRGRAPLSLEDILTIHRTVAEQAGVTGESAGAFRTSAVEVGRPLVGGFHQGAPVKKLALLMDQYVQFIDSPELYNVPPVIHALLGHFFLDTIHPFVDGNGRTSRLIAAAILSHRGYNLHGTYALVRYFYRHDIRYHTILHQSWKRLPFEVTPFIAFGMEGFVMELKSVDSFIKMKLKRIVDRDRWAPFRGRIGARRPRQLN